VARFVSIKRRRFLFFCARTAIFACLCGTQAMGAEREQGVLEIRIKDHREAIDDFAHLNIRIDKISISPKPGLRIWQTGWQELAPSPATVDLTQYVGKKTARIFRGAVEARVFDAFHLKLESIEGVLKKTRETVPVKNTVGPVKLSFQVPSKGETLLVIDLVVTDFSDHPPRGYELSIKGFELFANGKLIQRIPPG
jgi:hypothetical protein